MSKVLVTGGCGFIGSYVCEELIKRGHIVIAADITEEHQIEGAHYMECDILSMEDLSRTFNEDFDKSNSLYFAS